jgi:sugar O-acyltransferase (sialic acid O-acetyltransferase NeuD family)
MSKQVFLLGGGGHGRVVLNALLSSGVNVTGVLDPHLKVGDQVFGVPVMGGDDFLDQVVPTDVLLVNGLGANPCVRNRKRVFESLKARGFSFAAVRHPSVVIGLECDLGESSQIMAGVVLQNQVRIGANAVINTRASVDHDCVMGAHTFVAPGVVLSGNVLAGESAFIGAGAVVLPGIKIGTKAIVGAGAVVTKNIPDGWIVVGNPAVKIGMNK